MSDDRSDPASGPLPTAKGDGSGEALRDGDAPDFAPRYFVRHWRGELRLRTTFFVNCVALNIVVGLVVTAANSDIVTEAPRTLSLLFALLNLLTILIAVWQLIGLWRCASRTARESSARGRRPVWSRLAQVGAVVGMATFAFASVVNKLPAAWVLLQIAVHGDTTRPHVLRVLNHGKELEISGGIDYGTAAAVRTMLETWQTVRTVDLNSVGGRVAEARRVRDLIQAHDLATYTGAVCFSACTVIYMAGEPRYLAPTGKLGFHRFRIEGAGWEPSGNDRGERDLIAAGVDRNFAAKAFATPSTGLWVPDQATLLHAGVVTRLVDSDAFAALSLGGGITPEAVDKGMSAYPGVRRFKQSDPAAYTHMVQIVVDMADQGDSMAEIKSAISTFLKAAVAQRRSLSAPGVTQAPMH